MKKIILITGILIMGLKLFPQKASETQAIIDNAKAHSRGLKFFKDKIKSPDSLLYLETVANVIQREIGYEFDKYIAARKAEQDKKDLIAFEEKQKMKIIICVTLVGFILSSLLVILLLIKLRKK